MSNEQKPWELTRKEIDAAFLDGGDDSYPGFTGRIACAAQAKLVLWFDDLCTEHHPLSDGIERADCAECWQDLYKELWVENGQRG